MIAKNRNGALEVLDSDMQSVLDAVHGVLQRPNWCMESMPIGIGRSNVRVCFPDFVLRHVVTRVRRSRRTIQSMDLAECPLLRVCRGLPRVFCACLSRLKLRILPKEGLQHRSIMSPVAHILGWVMQNNEPYQSALTQDGVR